MLRYLTRQEILDKINEFELDWRRTLPLGNTFLCLYGFVPSAKNIELALPGDGMSLVPRQAHVPMPTVTPMSIKDRPKVWLVGGLFTLYNASRLSEGVPGSREMSLENLAHWGGEIDEEKLLLRPPFLAKHHDQEYRRIREYFDKYKIALTPENVTMARKREAFDFHWRTNDYSPAVALGMKQEREFEELIQKQPELGALFRTVDLIRGRIKDTS